MSTCGSEMISGSVLDGAEKEMAKLKDEFLSAEHYLLALTDSNGAVGEVAEGSSA